MAPSASEQSGSPADVSFLHLGFPLHPFALFNVFGVEASVAVEHVVSLLALDSGVLLTDYEAETAACLLTRRQAFPSDLLFGQ